MTEDITLSAAEQAEIDRATKIVEQNDRFRSTWGADVTVPGQIVVTPGVASLSADAQVQIMRAVQTFETFREDNDPYGDHTFGAFEITAAGEPVLLFWKIDLYDTPMAAKTEIFVAFRSNRVLMTVPSKIRRTMSSSAKSRATHASQSNFTLRQARLTTSLLTAPWNSP
jgi:hypothetical protein